MSSRYVNLEFKLTVYGEDEDNAEQITSFSGHQGWQNIQFSGKPPSDRDLRLVADLGRILNALAKEEDDTPSTF